MASVEIMACEVRDCAVVDFSISRISESLQYYVVWLNVDF